MAKEFQATDLSLVSSGRFDGEAEAESSNSQSGPGLAIHQDGPTSDRADPEAEDDPEAPFGLSQGMDPEGFSGPSEKVVKPLTAEALAAFTAAQERAGVIYISRIPPGMRPAKVRHLMSAYGEIGRVYLQQEDAKRAYLRRKYTATKKPHFTEGWVEFKDKKVARSVAEMLNAQPIGGKKGTRWRDDVWTMKYLPKFKWSLLTEQVAHEAAIHTAKLRVELSQSKTEQREYLKNVELARVLDKRAERKKQKDGTEEAVMERPKKREVEGREAEHRNPKKIKTSSQDNSVVNGQLDTVLSSIF